MNKPIKLVICKKHDDIQVFVYEKGILVEQYQEQYENKRLEGNIYLGKVMDVVKGMQSAFINIGTDRNAFIHISDIILNSSETTKKEEISKIIKPNENIIVQIKRDSNNSKGPRVTKDVKLTGKYVILMPFSKFITVSKKIENENERERLIGIVKSHLEEIKLTNDGFTYGAIIRTSAENKEQKLIVEDIEELIHKWKEILNKSKEKVPPTELYNNNGIVGKLINDFEPLGLDIVTNSEVVKQFIKNIDDNIEVTFENDINQEINQDRKIYLNCGGFITIDETEALVAIDVNSGKFTGKKNLEDTVLKVNLEAAKEVAKQIRLRDLGGVIIIDFIDMHDNKDREKVKNKIQEELKKDRSKVQVLEFTELGLLQLTRKHILAK